MSEDIDKHVLRRFEICHKLGKGVREGNSRQSNIVRIRDFFLLRCLFCKQFE